MEQILQPMAIEAGRLCPPAMLIDGERNESTTRVADEELACTRHNRYGSRIGVTGIHIGANIRATAGHV
jgi:hypothetical protein